MSNTTKLLYILPDTAYIAELIPAKKEHTFAIQAFRQINGTFMDDNEFIADNVEKLLKKIDPAEYHLILPDFLFTNTIVDVNETSETNVKKYLKEQLLPNLGISKETHEIDTFILTQHKTKTKVQLSALEKSVLAPIQKALGEHDLKISKISPLTWTIKSIVSLEPSLTVVQLGSMLYLGQHYIGVDQTISFSIEEPENVMEAVKTLKGAEPNIQTLYLLTNQLVENKIKEQLSGTLPIQQLAIYSEEDAGIPSHVKQIIETGARTLDISDFPVPQFQIEKLESVAAPAKEDSAIKTETVEELPATQSEAVSSALPTPSLPTPAAPELKTEEIASPEAQLEPETEPEIEPTPVKTIQKLQLDDTDEEAGEPKSEPAITTPLPSPVPPVQELEEVVAPAAVAPIIAPISATITPAAPVVSAPIESGLSAAIERDIPVSTPAMTENPNIQQPPAPSSFSYPSGAPATKPERTVIKNKNDAGSLVKIIGITISALVVTVGIGVGIGVGLLSMSEKKANNLQHSPVTDASPAATSEPTAAPTVAPVASPVATPAKDKLKILIVNATTTAGKAGKFKSSLQTAGYKSIETGNAKGTYPDKGTFLLGSDPAGTLTTDLGKAVGVTLVNQSDKTAEDAKGAYDVVIVIAE